MAKEKEAPQAQTSAVAKLDTLTPGQVLSAAEGLKVEELEQLTGEYLDFSKWEEGHKEAFLFSGLGTYKDQQGQEKDAVYVTDKNGNVFITAASVLVRACERLQENTIIIILYKGKKRANSGGSYYDLTVYRPRLEARTQPDTGND